MRRLEKLQEEMARTLFVSRGRTLCVPEYPHVPQYPHVLQYPKTGYNIPKRDAQGCVPYVVSNVCNKQ